jgi:GMP synthase (glutamine-hydrolysing)
MSTKPFLLLQSRPEEPASDDEYKAFCSYGGLAPEQLIRVRLDRAEFPDINLQDYSGILMGGGPANFAYDDDHKSDIQKAFEPWLFALLEKIIATDMPFLGACLGIGALVKALGGEVSFDYHESLGAVEIELSNDAKSDGLLAAMPAKFEAFVGHKEGVATAPKGAVELARSNVSLQMIRIGQNVYGTQFHPELDAASLVLRIETYKYAGYFAPEEADALIAAAWDSSVTEPTKILEYFVSRYSANA